MAATDSKPGAVVPPTHKADNIPPVLAAKPAVAPQAEPIKVDAKPVEAPKPVVAKVEAPKSVAKVEAKPVEALKAAPAAAVAKPVATKPVVKIATVAKAAVKKAPAKKVAAKKAPAKKVPVAAKAIAPKPVVVAAAAKVAAPIIEKAKAAVPPAITSFAETIQKEVTIMATKFETPKMMTEFNDRAKAAVEKGNKLVQEMGEFSKGNVEALVESGRIAAKGFEALGQDAADYSRKSFEGLTSTLKSLSSVKSPADFFKLQSDYLRASFDSAVAQSSKSTEAFIKLAGDAAQPLSTRFALAAEKVKAAA